MKVPEGSQSGRKMRIKGKGLGDGDFILFMMLSYLLQILMRKRILQADARKMNFNPRA